MKPADMRVEADRLSAQAEKLRADADAADLAELKAQPLIKRLVFAAYVRCACGAGMAYDRTAEGPGPFKGPSQWSCSDILRFEELTDDRKASVKAGTHDRPMPFAFYEVKSENTPSAHGSTTRPAEA